MNRDEFHSTQSVVVAVREVAREYDRELSVSDDIGADRSSRRTSSEAFAVTDPDGSLPHEAYIEFAGAPRLTVQVFAEGDARITVEGVEFHDVPWDSTAAFVRSVLGGLAHVRGRSFPPAWWLVVSLPGDVTYKELVPPLMLSPWLSGLVR